MQKNGRQCKATIGDISCDDMNCLLTMSDDKAVVSERKRIFDKYPVLAKAFSYMFISENKDEMFREFLSDLDSMYNLKSWGKNKQVFKFDKDFLEELIRTENLSMSRDLFDYLPFEHFYVDISDNEKLCKEIYCKGFFVYVRKKKLTPYEKAAAKLNCDSVWKVHICKVNEDYFFTDLFCFENEDGDRRRFSTEEKEKVKIQKFDENNLTVSIEQKEINPKMYENIVFQILTYLSSIENDVVENEESKKTYRKPNPNFAPKHKFSEIQSYDVGVRFGSAFRKWKKYSSEKPESNDEMNVSFSSGKKKRPHARRAHWSHYWYGKKDSDERVRRKKWVAETFIGVNNTETSAVIHSVKK